MSPVNNDDSGGAISGQPLTRKEFRARERLLATQGNDVVRAQSGNAGQEVPPAPQDAPTIQETPVVQETQAVQEAPAVPAAPPTVPAVPTSAPSVSQEGTAHANAVHANVVHESVAPGAHASHEAAPDAAGERTTVRDTVPAMPLAPPVIVDAPEEAVAGAYAYEDHQETAGGDFAQAHGDVADNAYEDFRDGHGNYVYEDDHAYAEDQDGHDVMRAATAAPAVARPSKKVIRRRRFLALFLTLAVFVTALVVGAQFLKPLLGTDKPSDYPGPGSGEVKISVPPGAGTMAVANDLEEQEVVANAETFLQELNASGGTLSPGDFTFKKEMKNSDAVAVLLNNGKDKVMYVALNAGLRIGESLQAISEGSGVPLATLKELSDAPAQFGVPAKARNLEGFLAPGEYRFPLGTPAKDILQKLVDTTLDELKAQGITDPNKQYDTIIVASIVQAEGGQAEYGDVAGAIYNRLKPDNAETNGLIQSDATVTYGLNKKSFHLEESEKADKNNPYNTYANVGLPVGPIGSPGKTAIDAAAKPKSNDFLYWVTINLDTKETKFSRTLEEHNRYVEQYNDWCAANAGRCV